MLTQFAYSNSRFLACISQIVDRGSFPRRVPNASRPITVPFDRGRLFHIPFTQTFLHDRRSTNDISDIPFDSTGVFSFRTVYPNVPQTITIESVLLRPGVTCTVR